MGTRIRDKEGGMNVFDQAMKFEREGLLFYYQLSRRAWEPSMKTTFRWLAEQEDQHHKLFRRLKAGSPLSPRRKVNFLPIRKLLKRVRREMLEAEIGSSRLVAFRKALRMETMSEAFYLRIAAKADDVYAARAVRAIAAEERKHAQIIENLIEGMGRRAT